MKTSVKIGAALVIVVAAYTAAAWYAGRAVETAIIPSIENQIVKLDKLPQNSIKVLERKYEPGLYGSSYTFTFVLYNKLKVTVRSRFSHSPFAGGSLTAVASDDEVVLEGTSPEIAELFGGGKKIAEGHTVYYTNGTVHNTFSIPASEMDLSRLTDRPIRIAWEGVKGEGDYVQDGSQLQYKAKVDRLVFSGEGSSSMEMKDITLESQQKKLPDSDWLFTGTQKIVVEDTQLSPESVRLKRLTYNEDVSWQDGFVDIVCGLGTEAVTLKNDADWGPFQFDVSFKHLHGPSLSTLYDKMMTFAGENPDAMEQLDLSVFAEPGIELLKHKPVFGLDRVSINTQMGEGNLSAHAMLADDFKSEDLSDADQLSRKINVDGEISVSRSLLNLLGHGGEKEINKLISSGYATEEAQAVKTVASVRGGLLSLNGKPFKNFVDDSGSNDEGGEGKEE